MPTVSPAIAARARKNTSAILRALAAVGQVRVAEQLGISESTVSRMKDAELDRIGELLAACGLKAVPVDLQLFEPERIQALQVLARIGVENAAVPSGFGELP